MLRTVGTLGFESQASIRFLNLFPTHSTVLICGDYNQPRLQWIPNADENVLIVDTLSVPASRAALLDETDFINMTQINYHRNQSDRTLDLVFCSDNYKPNVNSAVVALLPVDTHHPPLEISFPARRELSTDYSHGADNEPGLEFRFFFSLDVPLYLISLTIFVVTPEWSSQPP